MHKNVAITVFEVVGSPLCVASNDGQKVHDRLANALKEDRNVILSFRNVTTLTSAFLNSAIGQLYGEFEEDNIRSLLSVKEIARDDLALVQRVVATAKQYFKDPLRFDKAVSDAMEEDDT